MNIDSEDVLTGVRESFQDHISPADLEEAVRTGVRNGFDGIVSTYEVQEAVENGVRDAMSRHVRTAVTDAVKAWLSENPDVVKNALRDAAKSAEPEEVK